MLLEETCFRNTREGIEDFALRLTTYGDDVRAVLESTGNLWIQVHDRLEAHGFDVALSNPANSRFITEARVKTDKTDARALARLHRADMVPTCYVPDEDQRRRRELLRYRIKLVQTRTRVKNRVHSLLNKHGIRIPYKTKFSRKAVSWLRERSNDLGFIDGSILSCDLELLETLDMQISLVEEKIAVLAVDEPNVHLLMTMTGVGCFNTMLILTEICTIDRFNSDKKFSSWMGLAPIVRQSGEKTHIGGVTKGGNKRLRWVMIQCAHNARRHDPCFKSIYERYSSRKGSKSAVVAVAHEMARIIYYMLTRKEPYRGIEEELTERKIKEFRRRALNGLRN